MSLTKTQLSGRATHGVTSENSTLIAAHHRTRSAANRTCCETPDELRWQAGRFYFVSKRRVRRITQGEAVQQFARFFTGEYLEGHTLRADLLVASPTSLDSVRGVTREIERMAKGWTNGKRLRMAMVFESWAKHLRGGSR